MVTFKSKHGNPDKDTARLASGIEILTAMFSDFIFHSALDLVNLLRIIYSDINA